MARLNNSWIKAGQEPFSNFVDPVTVVPAFRQRFILNASFYDVAHKRLDGRLLFELNSDQQHKGCVIMTWEDELKRNVCTVEQLKTHIDLSSDEEKNLQKIVNIHPMSITRYYMSLIDPGDPNDPIRKMALPSENELNLIGSYDTSGEAENTKMPGLQHKYAQTALILSTNRCAMYCRHCFRKRLVGLPNQEVVRRFQEASIYIKKHPEINNVLISGGDPLILSTEILKHFLEELSFLNSGSFIRFGSRVPVTFPQRIVDDDMLLSLLKKHSLKSRRIYVVTQFNHPNELTTQSRDAIDFLMRAGVVVNNQTVLLKGINDDPKTLAELQNGLVCTGVNPYYVFQCRPVKRVKHHFQVALRKGCQIVEDARRMLNGHSKRFKYIMSHRTGKIEILGIMDDEIYFKYHQAKNPHDLGKIFKRDITINTKAGWLDDLN